MNRHHIGELDHECVSDHQLHKANRLAHEGMQAASFYLRWDNYVKHQRAITGGEFRALNSARRALEDAVVKYEKAMEAVDA